MNPQELIKAEVSELLPMGVVSRKCGKAILIKNYQNNG